MSAMTQQNQVYRCYVCGTIVEVLTAGGGELHCCGAKMVLMMEKAGQEGQEKHVPVIELTDTGVLVKVGEKPHPMQSDHYIEWIEAICKGKVCRRYLRPEETPQVAFDVSAKGLQVRAYCNKHGLWAASRAS